VLDRPQMDERVREAAAEIGHFHLLARRLAEMGVPVHDAMIPFVQRFDQFHASTAPRSWLESLVKAYLGDGLAADFYGEVGCWLDERTAALVGAVLADTGHCAFAEREVRAACEGDRTTRDRLALWGRRLLGEAITHAQHVVAERDALLKALAGTSWNVTQAAKYLGLPRRTVVYRMSRLGLRRPAR